MISHIVNFKISKTFSDIEKKEAVEKLIKMLEALPRSIEEIKYYEVGKNISKSKSAFDVILISEFNSLDELETYRVHPEHQKVVKYINEVTEQLAVVDFEK